MLLRQCTKFIFAALLLPLAARGENPGELLFRVTGSEAGQILAHTTVTNPGAEALTISVMDTARKEALPVDLEVAPLDLWVLVDASQMCIAQKVESYLTGLVGNLKSELPSKSRVTIASYKNPTVVVHSSRVTPGDLEAPSISCDPRVMSSSYEGALLSLLESQGAGGDLPTRVWVLTSGNVQLSESTVKKLRQANLTVHVMLYNPILRAEIGGAVRALSSRIGGDRFQFSAVNTETTTLPEVTYLAAIESPRAATGAQVSLEVVATNKAGVIAKTLSSIVVPAGAKVGFFRRHAKVIWSVIALLSLGILAWRLVVYYKVRQCPKCRRMQRFQDNRCPFCLNDEDAYLVGTFNDHDRRIVGKKDVVLLNVDSTEIGSQRKSRVQVASVGRGRRMAFAAIVRERGGQGRSAYRIIPRAETAEILVNGKAIRSTRYLAPGDKLQVNGTEMIFVTQRLVAQAKEVSQ